MAMMFVRARPVGRKPTTVKGVAAQMRAEARIFNIVLAAFLAVCAVTGISVGLSRENARVDAAIALEKGEAAEERGVISAEALCNSGIAPLAQLLRNREKQINACVNGKR